MKPAQARQAGTELIKQFQSRVSLNDQIRAVENQNHAGMVDFLVNLRQQPAVRPDQVRFRFQSECQV